MRSFRIKAARVAALVVSALLGWTALAAPAAAQIEDKRPPSSKVEAELSYAPVVKRAAPAVVNVYSQKIVRSAWRSPFADDPIFRRLFGDTDMGGAPREQVQSSLGSGVIVRPEGIIVTNNHVVDGADALRVVFADRREFPAKVLLADPRTDLAILKIDAGAEQLPTLRFADTRGAEVGDMVLAIGNPFGVGQTVTGGIISALARTDVGISDFSFFVQTDAAINPGNSGGALVDMKGDLVGINTAIFSRGGGSNGIGFAIPSEMVRRVVEDAITDGKIVRPWLGLSGQVVTAEIAKTLALPKPQGVLISDVFPGGPAEKAGLRRGDVVTAVDNQIVFDDQGVRYVAATKRPGDPVRVDYLRQNKKLSVNASVAAPPESPKRDRRELKGESPFDGAVVINLSPAVADELGIDLLKRGVMVLEIRKGGGAARFGLKPGDLVLEVNGAKVNSAADLDAIGQTPVPVWRVAIERAGKRIEGEIRF